MPVHTVPPPTKEFFALMKYGTEAYMVGTHNGFRLDHDGDLCATEFVMPNDFHSLISVEVAWLALAVVTNMAFGCQANYGSDDQPQNTHVDSGTITKSTTTNDIYLTAVSGPLASVVAGDIVGFQCIRGTSGNTNAIILGVRIRYT